MGLIVLLAVGGILGWLASIVGQVEDAQGLLLNIAVGIIGALGLGALTNPAPLLIGVSPWALLAGMGGAVALLCTLAVLRRTVLH